MTASHFPQSVVFRLNMLIVGGMTILFWSVVYNWLNFLARKYDGPTTSINVLKSALFGTLTYSVAVATIDTGYSLADRRYLSLLT